MEPTSGGMGAGSTDFEEVGRGEEAAGVEAENPNEAAAPKGIGAGPLSPTYVPAASMVYEWLQEDHSASDWVRYLMALALYATSLESYIRATNMGQPVPGDGSEA